jgi:hypothetical protein
MRLTGTKRRARNSRYTHTRLYKRPYVKCYIISAGRKATITQILMTLDLINFFYYNLLKYYLWMCAVTILTPSGFFCFSEGFRGRLPT